MKHINNYIIEKLKIRKSTKNIRPKNKEELHKIIIDRILQDGNKCNLNDIDVSLIKDMSYLFAKLYNNTNSDILHKFNGDISEWDVSNVEDMNCMFCGSKFNGDISGWDVSNVKIMDDMFAKSYFNGGLSDWDVSNVESAYAMFYKSNYYGDLSNWKMTGLKYNFDSNLMFKHCPLEHIKNKQPKFNIQ